MTEPPRVIVVHLYRPKRSAQILTACKPQQRPDGTEVYIGSVRDQPRRHATLIEAIPGVHYAPTFHLAPNENARLPAGRLRSPKGTPLLDKALDGPVPGGIRA